MRRALLLACLALAACGGSSATTFTQSSIRAGLVKPADLGKGTIQIQDQGQGGHIIFTPEDSVPTCPYVQRADDVKNVVQAGLELAGGNSIGRWIVGPPNPNASPLPVVTQGALVFKSSALAENGMKKVLAEEGKCPQSFTILGGPAEIVGSYTTNSRSVDLDGWQGFSQQLAHTSPKEINPDTYDDLATVVLHKGNAILYAGFATIKKVGQRANSSDVAQAMLKKTLKRLD